MSDGEWNGVRDVARVPWRDRQIERLRVCIAGKKGE